MANRNVSRRLTKAPAASISKDKPTPLSKSTSVQNTKRKRNPEEDGSEHEEASSSKKPKKAAPKKPSKPSSKTASSDTKKAAKAYKDCLAAIDKKTSTLDKKVRAAGPNSHATNSDTYAEAMVKFIKDVLMLAKGDVELAFNLMMEIGARSRGDFHYFKMCGFGGSEEPYAEMDEVMAGLIKKRKEEGLGEVDGEKETFEVRNRWEEKDAEDFVGVYKTGRPNKQQRGQLERHRMMWNEERGKELRARREKSKDWPGTALAELEEDADYIGRFGLEGYFVRSREMLKELKAAKGAEDEAS